MIVRRVAVVLLIALAGVTGTHALAGVAAAATIVALLNAYPRKVRR